MRSPARFALAVLAALAAAEMATWAFTRAGPERLLRPLLVAAAAFLLARFAARQRTHVQVGLSVLASVVAEELYLALYVVIQGASDWGKLANVELILLAVARGGGVFLAFRGEPRWIDGVLLAGPVVVLDALLTAISTLRALDHLSVSAVRPHLGQLLAWGAAVAVVLPVVSGRQRE